MYRIRKEHHRKSDLTEQFAENEKDERYPDSLTKRHIFWPVLSLQITQQCPEICRFHHADPIFCQCLPTEQDKSPHTTSRQTVHYHASHFTAAWDHRYGKETGFGMIVSGSFQLRWRPQINSICVTFGCKCPITPHMKLWVSDKTRQHTH